MIDPTHPKGGGPERQEAADLGLFEAELADLELRRQDRLNQGIEALTIELMRYHLSPHDLLRFEAGELTELRTQGTELEAQDDYYRRESKVAKQIGHGSPGVFVRDELTFAATSWGFSLRATTKYAQGRLTDASLSAFGDNVSTLEDLRESRELLIDNGMLPPEPQASEFTPIAQVEPLSPQPNVWVVYQPGQNPL